MEMKIKISTAIATNLARMEAELLSGDEHLIAQGKKRAGFIKYLMYHYYDLGLALDSEELDQIWGNLHERKKTFDPEELYPGRTRSTARALYENPHLTGYLFSNEAFNNRLDPWTQITGVDKRTDTGQIILEYGQTEEMVVDGDFEVYFQINHNVDHRQTSRTE